MLIYFVLSFQFYQLNINFEYAAYMQLALTHIHACTHASTDAHMVTPNLIAKLRN